MINKALQFLILNRHEITLNRSLQYAFLDESGTTSPFSGSHFLVVALVSVSAPRTLDLLVKRSLKKFGTSLRSGEMKGDASSAVVAERVLSLLASHDIAIIAVVVDKRAIRRAPCDHEDIYRFAVARAVRHLFKFSNQVQLCLDKRYTAPRLWDKLVAVVREVTNDTPSSALEMRQEDSIARKELQATDFVAWALFQKYEHADTRFYNLIRARLLVEEVVEQALW